MPSLSRSQIIVHNRKKKHGWIGRRFHSLKMWKQKERDSRVEATEDENKNKIRIIHKAKRYDSVPSDLCAHARWSSQKKNEPTINYYIYIKNTEATKFIFFLNLNSLAKRSRSEWTEEKKKKSRFFFSCVAAIVHKICSISTEKRDKCHQSSDSICVFIVFVVSCSTSQTTKAQRKGFNERKKKPLAISSDWDLHTARKKHEK